MSDSKTITVVEFFQLSKKMKGLQNLSFFLYQKRTLLNICHFFCTIFWSSGSQSETFFFSTTGIICQCLKTFLVVTAEGRGAFTDIY